MSDLYQPILSNHPAPGRNPSDIPLTLRQFIDLLKEEEDYWTGEEKNTLRLVTHLRKIFYDKWGWDTNLIRKAKNIPNRYNVEILDQKQPNTRALRYFKKHIYSPKYRKITYTDNDRIYGNTRTGQTPLIALDDTREVLLPSGYYSDIGHILAGVDACNYPDMVGPLPDLLNFLNKLLPHVDFNGDVATWLGDIASVSGDFFLAYLREKREPTTEEMQNYINREGSGSHMLADIDAYVIAWNYKAGAQDGKRFTEILDEYFYGANGNPPLRNRRFSLYCETVKLTGFDGSKFGNEDAWKKYYHKQLRDNITFQLFSLMDFTFSDLWILIKIWFNKYQEILKIDELLTIWVDALKRELKNEQAAFKK